jgi:precorrin-6B methylase 2
MTEQTFLPSATQLDPGHIMQVGLGFWASKTLLSAVKLELFTVLDGQSLPAEEIRRQLGLHEQALLDWLDALHSLGFLHREGVGPAARYANTPETAFFLNKKAPRSYLGAFFEMANDREYRFWANLETGLRTGKPQNEIRESGLESFAAIYASPERLRQFTDAMTGIQIGSFMAFAAAYDFSGHRLMLDVGGSGAALSAVVTQAHPHLRAISYDLPQVATLATENVQRQGVANRVQVQSGDFFAESFPKADLITMGNILHSFNQEKKLTLLRKAHEALPAGGVLAVIELIIDNERRHNTFALLMSLNMLIESDGGFNYTPNDLSHWAAQTGFTSTSFVPLAGPATLALLRK